jgi:hypothetical protein
MVLSGIQEEQQALFKRRDITESTEEDSFNIMVVFNLHVLSYLSCWGTRWYISEPGISNII